MDIKAVDDVSTKVADGELEAEVKEDRDEAVQVASAADSISELSDPVRLVLPRIFGGKPRLAQGIQNERIQICTNSSSSAFRGC